MLDLTFLSELNDEELENLACEARKESEIRKKAEQSKYWDKVVSAIRDYLEKGYSIKIKTWAEDYTVDLFYYVPEDDEIGVLNFEGEESQF